MNPRQSSLNPSATSFIPYTSKEDDNKTVRTENSSNDGVGERQGRSRNAPVVVSPPVNNPPARGPVLQHNKDMRYLLDNFGKIPEEYIADVYVKNKRNLRASADILKQIQIQYDRLPDSLGIGDTSEPVSAAVRQPSSKMNVAKGSSSSSRSR